MRKYLVGKWTQFEKGKGGRKTLDDVIKIPQRHAYWVPETKESCAFQVLKDSSHQ